MRNLITSLKNHNEQLKGEIQRYKKKLKDSIADINKVSPLSRVLEHQPIEIIKCYQWCQLLNLTVFTI